MLDPCVPKGLKPSFNRKRESPVQKEAYKCEKAKEYAAELNRMAALRTGTDSSLTNTKATDSTEFRITKHRRKASKRRIEPESG